MIKCCTKPRVPEIEDSLTNVFPMFSKLLYRKGFENMDLLIKLLGSIH